MGLLDKLLRSRVARTSDIVPQPADTLRQESPTDGASDASQGDEAQHEAGVEGAVVDEWWKDSGLTGMLDVALDAAGFRGLVVGPNGVRTATDEDGKTTVADMRATGTSLIRRDQHGLDIWLCGAAGSFEVFVRGGRVGFFPLAGGEVRCEDFQKQSDEFTGQLRRSLSGPETGFESAGGSSQSTGSSAGPRQVRYIYNNLLGVVAWLWGTEEAPLSRNAAALEFFRIHNPGAVELMRDRSAREPRVIKVGIEKLAGPPDSFLLAALQAAIELASLDSSALVAQHGIVQGQRYLVSAFFENRERSLAIFTPGTEIVLE